MSALQTKVATRVLISQYLIQFIFHFQLNVACATGFHDDEHKSKSVTLFDLMHTLQKNRKLIPSHSVYSVNMERLISRLNHPGRDD